MEFIGTPDIESVTIESWRAFVVEVRPNYKSTALLRN